MKIDKNIAIPMATVILICVFIVLYQKAPLLPTVTPIFITSVVLIVQKKSNSNFLLMWIFGIAASFLYIGLILGLVFLAKTHNWAELLFKFPY